LSVRTPFNAHLVHADEEGIVTGVHEMATADIRMNGGFFVFKRDVFEYIEPGEELVEEPFGRMIERQELLAYRHDGFFLPMDTIKDRQVLESLHDSGEAPWRQRQPGVQADAGSVAG
jgi:glucose-1-phosphate cytidylyltransferase